jgi:glucose-6-phosphate isomerase
MTPTILPFALPLDQASFGSFEHSSGTPRRLSAMKDSYGDAAAADAILANDDPVIYDFHAVRDMEDRQKLIFGVTTIYPGTVGDEYYMTKGHFHDRARDGDEIYLVIEGSGHLLLQARDGESQVIEMLPGALLYTPSTWAHRTVNSGETDLVFLSIWAWNVDYDYETIVARGGFPKRVVKRPAGPAIIDNEDFHVD